MTEAGESSALKTVSHGVCNVTHLVVNLQLADEGLDGGVAPAVPAAKTE